MELGDFKLAQEIDDYIKLAVKRELDKLRPKPAYATVDQILTDQKACMVRYVGETDAVRVPYNSVAPNEVGQTVRIEGVGSDRYITGIRGTSESEARLRDAEGTIEENTGQIDANKSDTDTNFNVIKSSRPLYEGVDPTGEGTFDYQKLALIPATFTGSGGSGDAAHTHSIPLVTPTVGLSGTTGLLGFIRTNLPTLKQTISWQGYKTGTVTEFYADLYKLSQSDGSLTKIWGSPNLIDQLGASLAWGKAVLSADKYFTSSPTEVYCVQFSMRGSGSVMLTGITLPAPVPPPGFVPQQIGGVRATGTTEAERSPDFIAGTTVSSYYSGTTVYAQIGTNIADAVVPRYLYDPFDLNLLATNYRLRGQSLSVGSGNLFYNAGSDGFGLAINQARMTTDKFFVELNVRADSQNTFVGVYAGDSNADGTYLEVKCFSNRISIGTVVGFGNNATQRAISPSNIPAKDYKVRLEIDPVSKRYSIFLNGSTTEFVGWTDDTNIVPRNSTTRYVGASIQQGFFDNAGTVKDLTAGDITSG